MLRRRPFGGESVENPSVHPHACNANRDTKVGQSLLSVANHCAVIHRLKYGGQEVSCNTPPTIFVFLKKIELSLTHHTV